MWLKAILLVFIGLISASLVWLRAPTWTTAALLLLASWAFCRAYYFAFYVLEQYIDPGFKFAGLGSLLRYIRGRGERERRNPRANKEVDSTSLVTNGRADQQEHKPGRD